MPIYTYQCPGCHQYFDVPMVINSNSDLPYESSCCHLPSPRTIVSAANLKFNGSGWTQKGR